MAKPTAETLATLENIATEIGAGKSFGSGHDHAIWNAAHDRALEIVASYRRGTGLFQMTENMTTRKQALNRNEPT
jgi:hypothetical protein